MDTSLPQPPSPSHAPLEPNRDGILVGAPPLTPLPDQNSSPSTLNDRLFLYMLLLGFIQLISAMTLYWHWNKPIQGRLHDLPAAPIFIMPPSKMAIIGISVALVLIAAGVVGHNRWRLPRLNLLLKHPFAGYIINGVLIFGLLVFCFFVIYSYRTTIYPIWIHDAYLGH